MTVFTVVERLWRGEDVAQAGRAGRARLYRGPYNGIQRTCFERG
jgi:hypothetical protein